MKYNQKKEINESKMDVNKVYIQEFDDSFLFKGKSKDGIFARLLLKDSAKQDLRFFKKQYQNAINCVKRSICVCNKYGIEKLDEARSGKFYPDILMKELENIEVIKI